jgi:hypothetical protein
MRHAVGGGLVLVLLLASAPSAARHQRDAYCCPPHVEVSPTGALTCPGGEFLVSGTGFTGHQAVRIFFDNQPIDTVRPGHDGSFQVVVTAPAADAGQHTVFVRHRGLEVSAVVTCVAAGEAVGVAFTGFVLRAWVLVLAGLLVTGSASLVAGRGRARRRAHAS